MAEYLKSLPASAEQTALAYDDVTTKALVSGSPQQPGAAIYLGYCVSCHGADGKGQAPIFRRSPAIRPCSTPTRHRSSISC